MKKYISYIASALTLAVLITLSITEIGKTAITELSGLAVAQTGSLWKNVRDFMVGDNMPDGVLAAGMVFYDASGANADRLRGTVTNGVLVDVTRSPGGSQTPTDAFANPTTFQGGWNLLGIFNGSTWDRWRGQVTNVQGPNLLNPVTQVSAANTALTVTVLGVAGQRIHLYKVTRLLCTPAGAANFNVTDGASVIYSIPNSAVPTTPQQWQEEWAGAGLTMTTGADMILTVSSCGVGNTSNLQYQADRF